MACQFDRLSSEIMRKIFWYLHEPQGPRESIQYQLTCKRFQEFAEIAKYESLTCSKKGISEWDELAFRNKPSRCKLVQSLNLSEFIDTSVVNRDFLERFPNIRNVSVHKIDWKLFSEVFTSDCCKLWHMPNVYKTAEDFSYFYRAAMDHCQTLRELKVVNYRREFTEEEIAQVIDHLHQFKNLEALYILAVTTDDLRIWDQIIDSLPHVKKFHFECKPKRRYLPRYISKEPVSRRMKSVVIVSDDRDTTNIQTYFANKFTNVNEWVSVPSRKIPTKTSVPTDDLLSQFMKAKTMKYGFVVSDGDEADNVSHLYTTFSNVDRSLFIGHGDSRMDFSVFIPFNASESTDVKIDIYCNKQLARNTSDEDYGIHVGYTHRNNRFTYINLLKRIGHLLYKLNVSYPTLHRDDSGKTQGGDMISVLESCPSLKILHLEHDQLHDANPTRLHFAHRLLKNLKIFCQSEMYEETFPQISQMAPYVTKFCVEGCIVTKAMRDFKEAPTTETPFKMSTDLYVIDMPYNSFDVFSIVFSEENNYFPDSSNIEEEPNTGHILDFKIETLDKKTLYFRYDNGSYLLTDKTHFEACPEYPFRRFNIKCKSLDRLDIQTFDGLHINVRPFEISNK